MFELPKLPYEYTALEPAVSGETMETHHSKHHQAYVNNANRILKAMNKTDVQLSSIIFDNDILIDEDLRHNIGGHYNHSFFWKCMADQHDSRKKTPEYPFDPELNLKCKFLEATLSIRASGWVWLVYDECTRDLKVVRTTDQGMIFQLNPNFHALLCFDVWEHAYYLTYLNDKKGYFEAWWEIIDWDFVNRIYVHLINGGGRVCIDNKGELNI